MDDHNRSDTMQHSRALLPLLLISFVGACSHAPKELGLRDEEEASGSRPAARARVLLTDAVAESLASFSATVRGVRLVYEMDGSTQNLLAAPLDVEFLGLTEEARLVLESSIPAGTIRGLELDFAPQSYVARLRTGEYLDVSASSDTLVADLDVERDAGRGDLLTFVLDVDLEASLSGDPLSGMVDFDPLGSARTGSGSLRVQDLTAVVSARDTGSLALSVAAFQSADGGVEIASLDVSLGEAALLVDELGRPFDPPSYFYTLLAPGVTTVELSGSFDSSGSLVADRIAIESQNGVVGSQFPVKLAGRVVDVIPGVQLGLELRETMRGSVFVDPILTGLGDPLVVDVALDDRTDVFAGSRRRDRFDVVLGQSVSLAFRNFSAPPFPAARVVLANEPPSMEGEVDDTQDLPEVLGVLLRGDDPHPIDGSVRVAIDGAAVALGVEHEPRLSPSDLVRGLHVSLVGSLTRDGESELVARAVEVRPGVLVDATVTGFRFDADGDAIGLEVIGGALRGSFGAATTAGPFEVLLEPAALLRGVARTPAELARRFHSLGTDQELRVHLKGIGDGTPDGLRAFWVDARVE